MSAKILDGRLVADTLQITMGERIKTRLVNNQRPPGLAVIIVGDDPASQIYVNNKRVACEKLGFLSFSYDLPISVSQAELEGLIHDLNLNDQIDGIIVQTPLPEQINAARIVECIRFDKDVDGFHPYNVGRLVLRKPLLRPCTPFGIVKLLQHYHISLAGLNAVVVGASNVVGRPMALELLLKKSTITVCHKYTKDLKNIVGGADLLIVAIGKTGVIDSQWIKPGAIVVDVGINRLASGKICGDIDFDAAAQKAAWITPVPGGVGPMTVTMLLENTLFAAEQLHS